MEFPAFAIPDSAGAQNTAPVSADLQVPPDDLSPAPSGQEPPQDAAPAPAQPPAGPPAEEMFPKHRYDAVAQRAAAAEQRAAQAVAMLERLIMMQAQNAQAARPPAEPELPPEELQRRQDILGQLFEVVPGLQRVLALADKTDAIERWLSHSQQSMESQSERLNRYAEYTITRLHDAIAPLVLGEKRPDGTAPNGKHLSEDQQHVIQQAFVRWVGVDHGRRDRYDNGDEGLRDEFVEHFKNTWVAPFSRGPQAQAVERQQRVNRLPVGGTSSAPVTQGPKKLDLNDEDAVFRAGWAHTKAQLNA